MRRVRYGVGMSLDGFIADARDDTGWMSLLDANLVDTIELGVCPIVLGQGRPFLPSAARSHRLTLTHQESFPSGLLVLHYDVDDVIRG